MKKFLFILSACFVCIQTISAQNYYESDSDIYGLGNTPTSLYANPDPVNHEISFYIQDGWGLGYQIRKDFNKYVGWNVFGVSYMSGFQSPADFGQANFKFLGVRGYTPAFKSLRAYVDLNAGYTLLYAKVPSFSAYNYGYGYYYDYSEDIEVFHHFGLDFGVGIQVNKSLVIGYNLNYLAPDAIKTHWAKISFLF